MVRRVLTGLCVGVLCIFISSCGQSYKVLSINVTPSAGYILDNTAPSGQLTVTATYSNTKTNDVTLQSNYSVQGSNNPTAGAAPINAVTVDQSGLVTASGTVLACTYVATTSGTTTTYTPYPYSVQVSYTDNGTTVHAPATSINVATAPGCVQTQ
jgi:hypothetical protein